MNKLAALMTDVLRLVPPNGVTAGNLEALARRAAEALLKGHVIAIPTDTVYGIAALAQDTGAVQSLYDIKGRNGKKPVAICVGSIPEVGRWGTVNVPNQVLHELLPGPVTLVFKRTPELNPGLNPDTDLVGIRIPDHEFVHRVAVLCGSPLALTSANPSASQSTLSADEFKELWPKLRCVFDGGRLGDAREGSTVVDLSTPGTYRVIRDGSALGPTKCVLDIYLRCENNM